MRPEIIAHGINAAAVHHSGLGREEEDEMVRRTLEPLGAVSGQQVTGWLSPGRAKWLHATPDILTGNGVAYTCDWANDDMPYAIQTANGALFAMPHAYETDDRFVLLELRSTKTVATPGEGPI